MLYNVNIDDYSYWCIRVKKANINLFIYLGPQVTVIVIITEEKNKIRGIIIIINFQTLSVPPGPM
jgi:hypothetical protein